MIDRTEIARGIYRISFWDEPDWAPISFPGASYNLYAIAAERPAIIQTLFRRTFARISATVRDVLDPTTLQYIVVPHHEGDSSGAINEWLRTAPRATALCSKLCSVLSLADLADREPRIVGDGEVVDLGSHRLRFLETPQVNQWDSLMVYEETTRTLFPNDLFSTMGTEIVTERAVGKEAIDVARHLGYQPDDRASLERALDRIAALDLAVVAPMHGPTLTGHFRELISAFRENSIAYTA